MIPGLLTRVPLSDGHAEVAHGAAVVALTLPRAFMALTPNQADDLADLLRRQARHARAAAGGSCPRCGAPGPVTDGGVCQPCTNDMASERLADDSQEQL
ncbi:MAG TPA: hypothetical protein VI172_08295 [Candidatus Dormibacteraeota bacterium]